MVAAVEHHQRVVGETFLLEHLEHRADGVVEAPDIGVVAGQFPADVRQVLEEARHSGDFLGLDPAAGRFALGEVVGAFHADERAVRIVAVDVVEKRPVLLAGHLAGSLRVASASFDG